MSERMFDPSNSIYKKVEDLPKKEQANFANVEEGGFVRKEAKKAFDDAKKIIEIANQFKEAGVDVKKILSKRIRPGMLKNVCEAVKDDKTAMDIMQERAEEEILKPVDALYDEAKKMDADKYPERIYLEKIRNNPNDLKGIPKHIWDNKKFAIEAVRLNRKALAKIMNRRHNLNGDIEVILEAVKQDGLALQYAGLSAQANKDIVLEAVKQNPYAIKYASKDIKEAVKKVLRS